MNPPKANPTPSLTQPLAGWHSPSWKVALLAAALLLSGRWAASASNVTLKASDAAGTSSFTSSANWNPAVVPGPGNAFFTAAFTIRTTNATTSGANYVFQGDSLSIDAGGRLLAKIGNNVGGNTASNAVTFSSLILNGGYIDQAGANSDNPVCTVAGNITVAAASGLGALGATTSGSANFETLNVTATISGSAALVVSGSTVNGGQDTGVVRLGAANPYSGTITVTNGNNSGTAVIASTVNRGLQLNNVDALSNATLNLVSVVVNPVSFATAANSKPFNVGALTGKSSQTLMDTASVPVTLSVGANNASTTFTGVLTDSGNLVKVGSGTLTLTAANTYSGTTTVSAGSLQLGNGGATGSLYGGNTMALNGNLTINRNNAVVQGVDFTAYPITGSGSFTQAGTGTTVLNAANSYSGATTVSAGKLVISTAQTGTGAITVANGAKLDVSVSGTSQLAPSTLTLGTSAASTLEFDGVTSTTIAPLNVGTLAVGGPVTVNINTGTFAAGNSYPLIHWSGSGPANASGFALGVSPGLTATFSVTGSTLYLNVAAVSDIWSGAVNGNWDTATANWSGNATVFANGQSVLFDDTAVGTTFVTVSVPVQPGSMVFNNSALAYTITSSGANVIGGSGGLALLNTGNVTLSGGANTFTGPTTITHGFLSVGSLANGGQPSDIGAASAASGNLVFNGGTLQYTGNTIGTDRGATLGASGGTLEVSTPTTVLTSGGVIAGSGGLTKTGSGTLTLAGASTFSGGLSVAAGQVNINNGGSGSASAIGVGPLSIADSTTLDNTSGADVILLPNNAQVWNGSFIYAGTANSLNLGTGPVSLPANVTVTVNANTLTVGGAISGSGGVVKAGPGTLVLSGASTFSGTMDLQGGTLALGNDLAAGTGQLNLADGVTVQSADGAAHTITNRLNFGSGAGGNNIFAGTGNLTFTGSAANGTAKTMTVNNPRTEFSGVLSGAMARTVAGTGLLVYSGPNTYSAGTTINPGATLQLGNGGTNGSLSTSGVIDIEGTLIFNRSDALVQGIHFSSAPIIGAGGVVQAGAGTTTLNGGNTYTGPMVVNNGELFITTAYQAGGSVSVANGAKFGVLANAVTNGATVGNLTLGSGGATTLDFSYSLVGNPTNAALVANAVTISGTSVIRIGGTFTVGTFPVLKYSTLAGAFAGTVVGPRGVTATLSNDTVNHVINVTVSSVGSGIVWTGTSSISPNLWDLNTTTNWLIGGQPTVYLENVPPGDAVTFNDSGSGLVLLSNTVSPASMTLNDASTAYTFQGSGQITSPGGLTKVGAAPVTLNVAGTFAGNTVLSNGSLSLGANQSFANLSGNSAVTVSAGAPTLTVNNSLNTTFAGSLSGALTLTKAGSGTLTLPSSNNISGNLFVSAGTLTLDSGVINLNNYASVGHVGTDNGTLTLKGAANIIDNNDFNVGDVGTSVGTLNVQDSAVLTVNSFFVGSANGTGSTASGTVNQTGGTVSELNTAAGTFCIGGRVDSTSIGGVGVYNLSGGTLLAGAGLRVGSAGVGTLNQSGGLIIASNGVNVARVAGSSGTYNFDGGTLKALNVTSSTAVNATFNFNGGVLVPLADSLGFVTNLTQVNVRNGGVVVDTAGFSVTIGQALAHSSIPGDNAVDGGLTKRGNGTLTVAELGSSYTGPTLVLGGALNLSPASVYTLSSLTVSNAALGLYLNGGTASYTPTALTLAGNSALTLNYDLVSGTPAAALNLSGGFSVSGVTVINLIGYGFPVGQFPLVHYTGAPLANLSNFALGALPYGVTAHLVNNTANSSIDLAVTAASIATWIPLTSTDPVGTSGFITAGTWQDGNPPTPGNGYFTRTFSLRSPADAGTYTFAGSVLSVDTGGRFIMKGTNGQALTVNNLIINGGLVDYANGADNFTETLGGNITLQGALTSYMGALGSAGASETLFVTASIGGTGNLQLAGGSVNSGGDNGVVVFAGTNNYTGTTTVAGGTLLVNGANGGSAMTVSANATLGGAGVIAGPVTVQAGATLAPGTPTRGALTTAFGTLTLSGGATVGGTVSMKIDRAATPTSDRVIAPSVVLNPGATLVVNNLGSTNLAAGDTFTLFSAPVSGAFTAVTLPPLPSGNLYWTNRLAVNGTLAVASTVTVNTNPTNITTTVSGGTLTLSWPADHLGWHLQMQSNPAGAGLGTNWVTIPGSDTLTSTNITINPAAGSVFYRMIYP